MRSHMCSSWASQGDRRLRRARGPGPRDLRTILRAPFTKRTWSELLFLVIGRLLAALGFAFVVLTMAAGVVLAITFFGLAVIGLSLRGARDSAGSSGGSPGAARRTDRGARAVRAPPGLLGMASVASAGPHGLAVRWPTWS